MNNGLVTAYDAHVFHSFIHWTRKMMCQLLRVPVQQPLSGLGLFCCFILIRKSHNSFLVTKIKLCIQIQLVFLCYQLLQKKLSSYKGRVVSLEAFSVAVESDLNLFQLHGCCILP